MGFKDRLGLGLLAIGLTAASVPARALAVITGTAIIGGEYDQQVGNQGNPATGGRVLLNAAGSYTVGPLTGSGGGNTTSGVMTIALGLAPTLTGLPQITASATGTVQANSLDAANTLFAPKLSYNFQVLGPAPAAVPVLFGGFTTGSLTSAGDPNRLVGHVGTRIGIEAVGIANTFAPVGQQAGQAPDYFASNGNRVNLGWGFQAFQPVNYVDFTSTWTWGATLAAGETGIITMESSTEGGTTGQLRGPAVLTFSTAFTDIDPRIFIDPTWLLDHPGYSIVVDSAIGNGLVAAPPPPPPPLGVGVPEPGTAALLLVGLVGLAGVRRQWRYDAR
jgi:hypothetical protein